MEKPVEDKMKRELERGSDERDGLTGHFFFFFLIFWQKRLKEEGDDTLINQSPKQFIF